MDPCYVSDLTSCYSSPRSLVLPLWPHCCSFIMSGLLLPQSFSTGCSVYLECCSLRESHDSVPYLLVVCSDITFWLNFSLMTYLKLYDQLPHPTFWQTTPTPLPCLIFSIVLITTWHTLYFNYVFDYGLSPSPECKPQEYKELYLFRSLFCSQLLE